MRLRGAVVGLDTAPLIYYVEKNAAYIAVIRPFFVALHHSNFRVVTSMVTLAETLVHPLRNGDTALADQYRELLLNTRGITTHPISQAVAERTAHLRGMYRVRTPDALQLATALHYGATFFVTNDDRLPTIPGLTVIVLDKVSDDSTP